MSLFSATGCSKRGRRNVRLCSSFCCKIRDWPVVMNPFPASRLWMLGLNENLRAGMMVKGEVLECEKVTDEFRPAWKYSRPADELQLEAMTVTGVETASSTWICVDPGCKLEESDWGSVHGPVDRPFSI